MSNGGANGFLQQQVSLPIPSNPNPAPSGRMRGPPTSASPNLLGFNSFGTNISAEVPSVSNVTPLTPTGSEFVDGAVELSVRAREFVPKFVAPSNSSNVPSASPSALPGGQSLPRGAPSGILAGINIWPGSSNGLGLGADLGQGRDDLGPPPLIFPSSQSGGTGVSMSGADSLNWGSLADTSPSLMLGGDLSMAHQQPQSRLNLVGPISGGLRSNSQQSRFSSHIALDDGDLDMDAALLGSGLLGNLEDGSDLLGGETRRRQPGSFLSSLSNTSGSMGGNSLDSNISPLDFNLYMGNDNNLR